MQEKKLVLDTNIFRYLYYNDNVHSSSRNFLDKRIDDLFSKFGEIYVPKVVEIELEYFFKRENKNKEELSESLEQFKILKIDERSFYVLKAIEEIIKKTKNTNKYNLSDYMIIASIISNFTDGIGNMDSEVSLLTADINDFEIGLLNGIFDSVKYENIGYVLQEEKFMDTKKYNSVNIFNLTFNGLNEKFRDIGKDIWFEDISF